MRVSQPKEGQRQGEVHKMAAAAGVLAREHTENEKQATLELARCRVRQDIHIPGAAKAAASGQQVRARKCERNQTPQQQSGLGL